jgi:hypothetical protein
MVSLFIYIFSPVFVCIVDGIQKCRLLNQRFFELVDVLTFTKVYGTYTAQYKYGT